MEYNSWLNTGGSFSYLALVDNKNAQTLMNDPMIITRDEVNWRGIYVKGDINKDGSVDILDYIALSSAFGTNNPAADLNGDGVVNILDYMILSYNFGKKS